MSDYAPLLEEAFRLDLCEDSYDVDGIEGEIPAFVRGTYYLNGPALFARNGFRYRNWLDGDGMVCALQLGNGGVHFTNRFVRSNKLVMEERAGRPIFRAFGTAFPSDQLKWGIATESPINVSVYPFRHSLLAFGEQTLPYELDPQTLQTRGPYNFDGQLNDISPFAAHPKFDAATGALFNFGVSFSAAEPRLNVYHFDKRGRMLYRRRLPLPYPCSLHDFSLSRHYAVFYLSPYVLNLDALRHGGRTTMECLAWEPDRGSWLLLVARESGAALATIAIGRGYCLHLINSFEDNGRFVVDLLEFERPIYDQYQQVPQLFTDVGEGRPVRLIIDVARATVLERCALDYRKAPDFPSIDPRQAGQTYHDFWMLGISATGSRGRKFFDQLVHAAWNDANVHDIYQAPPFHYLGGEPAFVADPEKPSAGVVISQRFDAEHVKSAFVIFDAFNVARGPVATIPLKHPVHLGFHSSFCANSP